MSASAAQPVDLLASSDLLKELGSFLVERDLVGTESLSRAERAATESGMPLTVALTRLGLLSEADCCTALAALTGWPRARETDFPEEAVEVEGLPQRFLHANQILPVRETPECLTLALADPANEFALRSLQMAVPKPLSFVLATPGEMESQFERLYAGGQNALDATSRDEEAAGASGGDVERLKDLASEAPVVRFVTALITRAVEARASDIHIDPTETGLRVRYRVDGHLQERESPPPAMAAAVISRLKLLSQMNIADHRLPQDGRIKMSVRGQEVDLRVACLPSVHGESIVLRILDRSAVVLDFDRLGFSESQRAAFQSIIHRPNGIVLVTGPTGSGKTTTLYTALSDLNQPDVKIITAEDPVEYRLKGIVQVQVRPKIGLDFAQVLRASLRHNPNIILIGEIRDTETAQIAVQASLTGHLVLSTLHTNSAGASVARLIDMGIEDYLITSTLNGVLAQRLVRTLCTDCRRPVEKSTESLGSLARHLPPDHPPTVTLYEPVGCPACNGSGYRGRTVISELLTVTDSIRTLILKRAEAQAIQAQAIADGMRPLLLDGLDKALAGMTTLDDVLRAAGDG